MTKSQFSLVTQSCPTLCDPMDHSTPGLPVHYQLPKFTQTHVHWEDLLEKEGIGYPLQYSWASLVAQVKNLPAMWETWVLSLGWEDLLEKRTATHSSILAWRIPWAIHGVEKSQTQLSDFHVTSSLQPSWLAFKGHGTAVPRIHISPPSVHSNSTTARKPQ